MADLESVPPEELNMALSGPSVFTNKFYVLVNQVGIRISFAEQANSDKLPIFRSSVFMSMGDALTLHKLLGDMLRESIQGINVAEIISEQKNA